MDTLPQDTQQSENSTGDERYHVVVVCTGNICRSPMGEVILRDAFDQAGLADAVRVSSCGTGGWHVGDGADERAVAALADIELDGSKHRAAQFGPEHASADLLLALDHGHVRALRRAGVPEERIRLVRSFDPNASTDEVADPYYGDREDFDVARDQIVAARSGIVEWVEAHQHA